MTLLYGEMVVLPIRTIAQEIDQLQQALGRDFARRRT
jgi:hypothetical protein